MHITAHLNGGSGPLSLDVLDEAGLRQALDAVAELEDQIQRELEAKEDSRRKEQQARELSDLRQSAASKLTPEEREAAGL